MTTERQPVLFLSHGAPPLADDQTWTGQLHDWASTFDKPRDVLVISAHWEAEPITVSSFEREVPLTYDFWGFDPKYYQVTYDAPLAPTLAREVAGLVATPEQPIHHDPSRGLDHGAYVPLKELFPEADVPVLQMSLPTLDPRQLFALGERLAPLRDRGTMVVASGFTTHNLRWFDPAGGVDVAPPTESAEFDQWAAEAIERQDVDAILDFQHTAPAARAAHPRTEHWAPLYVALGMASASGDLAGSTAVDGFWYGLSKRSWQFG